MRQRNFLNHEVQSASETCSREESENSDQKGQEDDLEISELEVSDSKVQLKEETKERSWEAIVKNPVGSN